MIQLSLDLKHLLCGGCWVPARAYKDEPGRNLPGKSSKLSREPQVQGGLDTFTLRLEGLPAAPSGCSISFRESSLGWEASGLFGDVYV